MSAVPINLSTTSNSNAMSDETISGPYQTLAPKFFQEKELTLWPADSSAANALLQSAAEVASVARRVTDDSTAVIVTFRGSRHPPEQVFKEGFPPDGNDMNLLQHAGNYKNSGYISTSKEASVAIRFASNKPNSYVYTIRADPSAVVDVNRVLGDKCRFPKEKEIAFPFGVNAADVLEAHAFKNGAMSDVAIINPQHADGLS